MAEDGIEDYALAKRKAARQAGMPDTRELPTNEEIDDALRTYQQIYHQQEHRERLRELRETALRAMRELARFNPHLTGSVLSGNAGKYADINLQLFTDNAKAVELYLIDRGIPYRTAQSRLYAGGESLTVPVYNVERWRRRNRDRRALDARVARTAQDQRRRQGHRRAPNCRRWKRCLLKPDQSPAFSQPAASSA